MWQTLVDATDVVWGLRQVKTPYEQEVLRRSGKVSSDAHRAAMRATRPGRHEYEVEAALEKVYLESGAWGWSYPSIVGSGPNATILHYERSRRRMEDGDVLLIDAAANYEGLTVDITRSWPVNGRFSPEQAGLWRLVLAAQEAGKKAAVAGNLTADVEEATAAVVRKGLLDLGLVTDPESEQFRTWYTLRVEDSFLLTEDGLERLSATVPRTVEEIEFFMAAAQVSADRDSR